MNNSRFVASHGISEIFVEHETETWTMADSTLFDRWKESLPIFRFFVNISSLYFKYCRELDREDTFHRIIIKELAQKILRLIKGFEKIEDLCLDLYCTGQLRRKESLSFYQFMNAEPFDFHDRLGEMKYFKKLLISILEMFPYVIKNNRICPQRLIETIMVDFIKQMRN